MYIHTQADIHCCIALTEIFLNLVDSGLPRTKRNKRCLYFHFVTAFLRCQPQRKVIQTFAAAKILQIFHIRKISSKKITLSWLKRFLAC